ncbi:response regulator [Ramlibacter sp. MAHUQ-53]|uniref:response regulator n=1 Tax=unclassified Ramlibacter TaxID=2617605 RepID=UPI00363024B5
MESQLPTPDARPTLLVVDDDPTNLSLLTRLLEPHYDVRCADNGPLALDLALQAPLPDLILLDIMMPGMDGHELMAALKSDPRTHGIPVIFLTAMGSRHEEEAGLLRGAVDYVTKPSHPSVLLARVRTHVELKQARDQLARHNASLEAEVARRMEENERIQDLGIHALARLAEIRDPETGRHLQRTALYVRTLATLLREHPRYAHRLTGRMVGLLARSAPLHDIGKVGIPDSILRKPGRFDEEEWAVMKTHAELGAQAIERAEQDTEHPVEFLAIAKSIARWHHENWDGTGYPDGLSGDDIPLAAQLMRIADAFDALVTRRVYKEARDPQAVRAQMAVGRGTQFSPDLFDVFDANFEKFEAIARRHQDRPPSQPVPEAA